MKILGVSARSLTVGITSLLILDLIALAAFAVHRTTVTTTTTRPAASAATTAPGGAVTPLAPPAIAIAVAPPGSIDTDTDAPSPSPTTKAGGGSAPSSAGPSTGDLPSIKPAAIGKCPVKIATPDQLGGVQSFVPFAPAFGPFSAEAFAMAAAYQPELQLLGPILAQYPKAAPVLEPLLAPILDLFARGTNTFFGAISPFYGPYRTEILSAETKLAAALAPYSAQLAGTPVAGCVVELEAALVGDTKSAASTGSTGN